MAAVNQSVPTSSVPTSRYRSMAISIAVFIVLVTGILLVSIFSSMKMQRDNAVTFHAGQMHAGIQSILKELYNLKLHYGEDPNSPVVQKSLATMADNQKRFNETLAVFTQGGHITDSDGQRFYIEALQGGKARQALNQLQQHWQPLNQALGEYLKDASSIYSHSQTLDLAVLSAQDHNRHLHTHVSTLLEEVEHDFVRNATRLRWAQAAGIVAAIVYFLLFIHLFMRRLQHADRLAQKASREVNEIMSTVSSGLFLLDRNLIIGSQYSAELETILGRSNLGGLNLLSLLQDMIEADKINVTASFVQQLFNHRVRERLIADLNPLLRVPVQVQANGENRNRYLDFRFKRVYEDKEIVHILVSVVDSSDAVRLEERLQQEREQNDTQLKMLGSLVEADPAIMNEFIEKVEYYADKVNGILKDPAQTQSALRYKAEAIFREIHSLKGEASALKLASFVALAESFEDHLQTLTPKSSLTGEDFLPLTVLLEELLTLSGTINDLNRKVGSHHLSAPQTLPAEQFKNSVEQFVADLASRNHKQVGVSFAGTDLLNRLPAGTNSTLRELSQQLLRNAVVHGIESPNQRSHLHKMAIGHIHIHFWQQDGELYFSLQDDGHGIDYERVRNRAVRQGLYSAEQAAALSEAQLNQLLFASGFSTLDGHTEDAGRGVGLDMVKSKIFALGGRFRISSEQGRGTRFLFKLPPHQ